MKRLLLLVLAAGCSSDPGPCRSPALSKGPWVLRADAEGASILWETRDSPACVAVGVTPEAGGDEVIVTGAATTTTVTASYGTDTGIKMPDVAGTYYLAHVDARGLAAGTCYGYRVRSTDATQGEVKARFCTARKPDQYFKFFAIGDTNPILGHTTGTLAAAMPEKPDFTVHMGDIQYYSSIGETWAYWFGPMAPMLRTGSFFPAVGNHENELNGLEYADYFDRLFHQPSLDGTPQWYRFQWGGVWFHTIDTEEPFDSGSAQYTWLSNSLAEVSKRPDYRFSVVYMHRNLYTLGDAAPQVDQRMHLSPIFVANKVRLVLSGHMHGYERFEVPGEITYVTTAGGGGVINDINANVNLYPADAPYRVASAAKYHGVIFEVTPMGTATRLHGRAIDETGATIDDFTHDIP
jgi:hypothetical protein